MNGIDLKSGRNGNGLLDTGSTPVWSTDNNSQQQRFIRALGVVLF